MSKLSVEDFLHVVTNTPLVSIDFVIENSYKQILIGKRLNEPACGYWFVPGGRILKGERFAEAIDRLLAEELGLGQGLTHFNGSYQLMGIYDHLYPTCFYKSDPTITTTHYVVIGLKLHIDADKMSKIDAHGQHSTWKWLGVSDLLSDPLVHENTKRYFSC